MIYTLGTCVELPHTLARADRRNATFRTIPILAGRRPRQIRTFGRPLGRRVRTIGRGLEGPPGAAFNPIIGGPNVGPQRFVPGRSYCRDREAARPDCFIFLPIMRTGLAVAE
jgi:hypothetical protein